MISAWAMNYMRSAGLSPGQAANKAALKTFLSTRSASANNPRLKANTSVPVTLTIVPFATGTGSYTTSHRWANNDTALRSQGGIKTIVSTQGAFPSSHINSTGGNTGVADGSLISTARTWIKAPASATTVYARVSSSATVGYRFLIDDGSGVGPQYISQTPLIFHPDASSQVYAKFDFTDGLAHTIGIESCYGFKIDGFFGLVTDTYTAPTVRPFDSTFKMIVAGDSFEYGAGDGGTIGPAFGADNLATFAGDSLDMLDTYASAVSGTGWVFTSGGFFNLPQRRSDITATGPWDIIVPAMGTNDRVNGISRSAVAAAVTPELIAYRAAFPNALIFPVLCWNPSAPGPIGTAGTDVNNGILDGIAGAGISGCIPLDPGGVVYSQVPGNNLHPDTAGSATLGAWLESSIRAYINS